MDTRYLENWDTKAEQQKAEFMEHCYRCSGRNNGLYTGLWQAFCLQEAGPHCRNLYFEQQQALKEYLDYQAKT
jgi:hypothetical protein